MKIVVDRGVCVGHARCNALSPELFVLDDEGYIATDDFVVPVDMKSLARRCVGACPEGALQVVDDETEET